MQLLLDIKEPYDLDFFLDLLQETPFVNQVKILDAAEADRKIAPPDSMKERFREYAIIFIMKGSDNECFPKNSFENIL